MRWSVDAFDFRASASSLLSFSGCVLGCLLPFHIPIELSAELQYGVSCAGSPLVCASCAPCALELIVRRCSQLPVHSPCALNSVTCRVISLGRSPDLPRQLDATLLRSPSYSSVGWCLSTCRDTTASKVVCYDLVTQQVSAELLLSSLPMWGSDVEVTHGTAKVSVLTALRPRAQMYIVNYRPESLIGRLYALPICPVVDCTQGARRG